MRELHIADVSEKVIKQLPKGAFITVKNGDKINTMTIGWATFGRVWNKPVVTAMVRYSRFTHNVIKDADSFTISFSMDDSLKEALALCGTKSGRDMDKFNESNITPEYIPEVESPYIGEGDLHIVCKIVYRQPMDPDAVSEEIKKQWYKDDDYHVIYYGEIVKVLAKE